jgi:hypothetical protein
MNEPIDMMSDEWLDEFERNWGITPRAANTDTDSPHKNSSTTTDSDQTKISHDWLGRNTHALILSSQHAKLCISQHTVNNR